MTKHEEIKTRNEVHEYEAYEQDRQEDSRIKKETGNDNRSSLKWNCTNGA